MLKRPAGTDIAAELAPYAFTTTANGIAAMGVSLNFTTNAESLVTYNYTGHYNATFNQFGAPPYDF
ncbi:hypothetical protein D0864_08856 [Hortaea werneckii]|uniref:Uncharacterized protein n=1 Tax=Hortaea werneckii TaxID=91943 RepID=A0A3M7EU31_HORWE|nr:hypothetical protein D0864_08856 [Hortaea werneckii]